MEILHGASLGLTLRKLSDSAKHRIWIASPYIGRWPAVSALLGANWWRSGTILLHVITDLDNPKNVNTGTLKHLLDRGPVRTLPGVHAKIYIVDDRALLTSANLTETAFTKRREIGVLLDADESPEAITIYKAWWDGLASEISPDEVDKWQGNSAFTPEAEDGNNLITLWSLPQKPPDSLFAPSAASAWNFSGYRNFLENYSSFAHEYEALQRLWPNAPLFIETDSFLNYREFPASMRD